QCGLRRSKSGPGSMSATTPYSLSSPCSRIGVGAGLRTMVRHTLGSHMERVARRSAGSEVPVTLKVRNLQQKLDLKLLILGVQDISTSISSSSLRARPATVCIVSRAESPGLHKILIYNRKSLKIGERMARENTSDDGIAFAVLIPAYSPGDALVHLVHRLAQSEARAVLVVDDGSGPGYADRFDRLEHIPKVHLLRHAINLGKGAALKTGINYFLCTFPQLAGVVTADADGQHTAEDVLRVGVSLLARTDSLILGTR